MGELNGGHKLLCGSTENIPCMRDCKTGYLDSHKRVVNEVFGFYEWHTETCAVVKQRVIAGRASPVSLLQSTLLFALTNGTAQT